jgi:hypothetical protein
MEVRGFFFLFLLTKCVWVNHNRPLTNIKSTKGYFFIANVKTSYEAVNFAMSTNLTQYHSVPLSNLSSIHLDHPVGKNHSQIGSKWRSSVIYVQLTVRLITVWWLQELGRDCQ